MIEIKRTIPGKLVDHGILDIPQQTLDECMAAITNARGLGGEYRIRVQWVSEDELADEQRKAAGH